MLKQISILKIVMEVRLIISAIFCLSVLAGCGGTQQQGGGTTDTIVEESTGGVAKSDALVLQEQNIKDMGKKPWSKVEYENIKKEQIPSLYKASERSSAYDYLDAVYVGVMVRDAGEILKSGCESDGAHNTLNAIMSELNNFKGKAEKAKGMSEVNSLKTLHDKASNFAYQGISNQSVGSFVSYDASYEAAHKSEARKYLGDSSLKCKQIRNKLESLTRDDAYVSRRRNYCQQITSLYLRQTSDASMGTRNRVKGLLVEALSESATGAWRSQIDKHYNDLNAR